MTIITILDDFSEDTVASIIYKGMKLTDYEFQKFCIDYLNKVNDEKDMFDSDDFEFIEAIQGTSSIFVLDDIDRKYREFLGKTYFTMFEV